MPLIAKERILREVGFFDPDDDVGFAHQHVAGFQQAVCDLDRVFRRLDSNPENICTLCPLQRFDQIQAVIAGHLFDFRITHIRLELHGDLIGQVKLRFWATFKGVDVGGEVNAGIAAHPIHGCVEF